MELVTQIAQVIIPVFFIVALALAL